MALVLSQAQVHGEPRESPSAAARTLEDLYAAHAPAVWRWVRRLGGASVDVEDLVQEVFLRAHRSMPAFRGASKETTWLYSITVRVVSRQRRRARATPARGEPPASEMEAGPTTPEEQMRSAQAEALLYRALDGLPERQRALLIAFELEELSGAQIAEALGIKQSTLWVQLHRARAALQRELEKLDA